LLACALYDAIKAKGEKEKESDRGPAESVREFGWKREEVCLLFFAGLAATYSSKP
jgi:hypothetical protein